MVCPPYPKLHPLQMTRSTAACSTRRRTACSTASRAGCARRHHSWGSVPRRTARRWARVRLLRISRPTHSVPAACKHDPCACDSSHPQGGSYLAPDGLECVTVHAMRIFANLLVCVFAHFILRVERECGVREWGEREAVRGRATSRRVQGIAACVNRVQTFIGMDMRSE